MIDVALLPDWLALVVALLLVLGAGLTLTGCIGLLRLGTFYQRMHAPTLGTTLGGFCIMLASLLYFIGGGAGLLLPELLITVFVTVTTPVTFLLLIKAARFRDSEQETSQDQDRTPAPD